MFATTIRETGINAVNAFLQNLPLHIAKGHFEDAIRMLDRVIGGLLGNPDSPVVSEFRSNEPVLFPGGLEKTFPGRDIVLVLNSETVDVKTPAGRLISYKIPKALKHPEKGVAQIIGIELAEKLFQKRADILNILLKKDGNWLPNVEANKEAQTILRYYPSILAQSKVNKIVEFAKTEIEKKRFENALAVIDAEIRSLLAQSQSNVSHAFVRLFTKAAAPHAKPQDVILVLSEQKEAKKLKAPEKGLAKIIGRHLTRDLLIVRGIILAELFKADKKWESSVKANKIAEQHILEMLPKKTYEVRGSYGFKF